MNSPRVWTVMGLMFMTAVLMQVRGDVDRVPPSEPLDQMPKVLGSWTGTDIDLDPGVLQVLGKGFFLNRVYSSPDSKATEEGRASHPEQVGLFIGYFPTQRTGQSIHSPQNCLPGAGWVFETSGVTDLTSATGKPIQVGEYLISNGTAKEEVLYWYRSHGRSVANDYVAKLYMLLDSIRYNRTDAALVRVVTQLSPGESREAAHQRAVTFAEGLSPLLPAYIPD
jgi:EpsI family protein